MDENVLAWLLTQDVAVRFQARRDLMGRLDPDLQQRISREGAGAVLLSARRPDGHWGRGFYQPKWTSSHYTLLELKNMGLSRDNPPAGETVGLILRQNKGRDGGLTPRRPSRSVTPASTEWRSATRPTSVLLRSSWPAS